MLRLLAVFADIPRSRYFWKTCQEQRMISTTLHVGWKCGIPSRRKAHVDELNGWIDGTRLSSHGDAGQSLVSRGFRINFPS